MGINGNFCSPGQRKTEQCWCFSRQVGHLKLFHINIVHKWLLWLQMGSQQHDYTTARLFVTDKIEIEGPDGMYTKQNSGGFIMKGKV